MFWDAFTSGARPSALDQRFCSLLWQSVLVAGGTAAFAALLGLPTGFMLARVQFPGRAVVRASQVLPLLVPPYISAIGWMHMVGKNGALNRWLSGLLGLAEPLINLYTIGGVIWVLGLSMFPLVSLIVMAALEHTSPDFEEDARLYASNWQVLCFVTLPLITPALLSAMLIVSILTLGEFAVPSFFAVNVYAVEVFTRFGGFFDFRGGTIASLPLLLIVLTAFALYRWLASQWLTAGVEGSQVMTRPLAIGRWRWLAMAFCWFPIILAVVLPLCALAWHAPAVADYTFAWSVAQSEATNSLEFSILAATLAVVLGLPVASLIVRSHARPSTVSEWLTLSSLAVPTTVLGIGLIRLWNRGVPFVWVYHSLWIVVLAMLARPLPLAVLALAAAWRQVPVVYEEFARVEGASLMQIARRVLFPLLRPGLIVAWCLAFVVAITELPAVLLVYPPGHATLPVRIYTMQHDGVAENVAALCLILITITWVPVGIAWLLARTTEGAG